MRKILIYGDAVLREKSVPVDAVDDDARSLAQDLLDTLAAADGVGLAAPQIGATRRMIAVHPPPSSEAAPRPEPVVYVDPEIVERAGGTEIAEEGCLSIPGIYEDVKRDWQVRVRARDLEGGELDLTLDGMVARIVQHEIDHLDGVLFIDRIGPMRRALLKKRLRELRE